MDEKRAKGVPVNLKGSWKEQENNDLEEKQYHQAHLKNVLKG